jgi:signal transduction histidine kinase
MPRTTIRIASAAIAPVIVLLAASGAVSLRDRNDASRAEVTAAVRGVNALMDRDVLVTQSALRVLADAPVFQRMEWPVARVRTAGVMADHKNWRNVILTNAQTGQEIWDMREIAAKPMRPAVAEFLKTGEQISNLSGGERPDCPCFMVHEAIPKLGPPRFVLSAELSPLELQRSLRNVTPASYTGAVVDRDGKFIARTSDFEAKRGTFSTPYVRDAIRKGGAGDYEGVTWEGVRNITAYEVSPLTGFSTHIAMPSNMLNILGAGSAGLNLIALALALMTAVFGAYYAAREHRRSQRESARQVQAQKLAAIGHFANVVAHDFNNLLTIISGSLQRIKKGALDSNQAAYADHAISATERGAALASQLLDIARAKPVEIEPVDIGAVTRDMLPLLARALGDTIDLQVKTAPDLPPVKSNRSQLETALLNMANNARDAMPKGGQVTIEARRAADKNHVLLIVQDNGSGMPADVAAKALDPYFTTKEAGKGTGLGLAQVQSLMAQSDGRIEIESWPGGGTRIALQFPIAADAPKT